MHDTHVAHAWHMYSTCMAHIEHVKNGQIPIESTSSPDAGAAAALDPPDTAAAVEAEELVPLGLLLALAGATLVPEVELAASCPSAGAVVRLDFLLVMI